jgi:hypothetical protein
LTTAAECDDRRQSKHGANREAERRIGLFDDLPAARAERDWQLAPVAMVDRLDRFFKIGMRGVIAELRGGLSFYVISICRRLARL